MKMKNTLLRTISLIAVILMFVLVVSSVAFAADSDGDGLEDSNDNCPEVYNPGQGDIDSDGAGDVCDNCPNDPDKTEPGVCGCGVPDTDTDGDSTPDCNDNCPNDPGKTEPGVCGCGVPDTDTDGDSIPDCDDNCPESKLEPTVIIADCDSGVHNTLFDDGCTMTDLIYQCADNTNDEAAFLDCVNNNAKSWKNSRLINAKEKGNIVSCSSQSGLVEDICLGGSVQKTGQTTPHAIGDDGDLQKGTAWPNPRFTDNLDGTITDNLTELIWLRDANCFGLRNWNNALSDCNGLAAGQCGLTDGSIPGDWRLPNRRELFSLIHDGYTTPAVPDTTGIGQWSEGDPFINVLSNFYWSSTSHGFASYAWVVSMLDGFMDAQNKITFRYTWPVRGGQ
jgi:hypothetical protein